MGRRVAVIGIIVLLAAVLGSGVTGANTPWVIQSTPNPTSAVFSDLNGVSCTSAGACTAVGGYGTTPSNGLTLAERWNGTSWTVRSTPNPAGATNSGLLGVSCVSASACIAVGGYDTSPSKERTLAERWNGSSWTIRATPDPTGATRSELSGVSCISATACTAVGDSENGSNETATLAERWNGTSWAIQPTADPTGTKYASLSSVSCTSAGACTAVGSYDTRAHKQRTLVERWNGSSWAIQLTRDPTGALAGGLTGVSCTSANACTAVGSFEMSTSFTIETLAESWSGASWTIRPSPDPAGAQDSYLLGDSCHSASACTAVGLYETSSGAEETLAESWNGSSWAIQSTPNPTGSTYSSLYGVSCPSASHCAAAGGYVNSSDVSVTLAERH
jgi:hypothetical protein